MKNRWIAPLVIVCIVAVFRIVIADGGIEVQVGIPRDSIENEKELPEVSGELWVSPFGVEKKLITFLGESDYTIDGRWYQITYGPIKQVLKNLARLNVDIDLIMENKIYGGNTKDYIDLVQYFDKLPVDIHTDESLGTNFNHTKTFLIDDERFLIATANLSYTSLWNNREYWFVSEDEEIAESLRTLFDKDWVAEEILPTDIATGLLVCPINCREVIESVIVSAQHSLWIEAQYIQDDVIVNLLEERADEIDLRVIVGEYQDSGRLDQLGTGVRILYEPYLHAKNILVDHDYLLMGSMNLSANALDNNREIGIIIDDPSVVDQFEKQFEYDWRAAK